MPESPPQTAERIIADIQKGFEQRSMAGKWEILFPPGSSDFEIHGHRLRLIFEVNYGIEKTGVARTLARTLKQGPVQIRLRAWFLNEFVERVFDSADEAVPIIFSIIEAHRPSGQPLPSAAAGAPELDDPDRPAMGADD